MVEKVEAGGVEVGGTGDLGVAPRITAADPALLKNGNAAHAMFFCKKIRGGEPMTAAADDYYFVRTSQRGSTPRLAPASVPPESLPREIKERITLHRQQNDS